jgi:hypothetical protein
MVFLLAACGPDGRNSMGEMVDAAFGGGTGSRDAGDPQTPAAACTTSPWTISPVEQWHPTDGTLDPSMPDLRMGAAGLEVAFVTNPSAGGQRRLAVRAPNGTWTFESAGVRVFGKLARGVDSQGTETQCWAEGPQVITSTTQIAYWCGTRVAGGSWTTVQMPPGLVSFSPAMAIDHADRVHLTYRTATQDVVYARHDPGAAAWAIEMITDHGHGYLPLAVDNNDCVHAVRSVHDNGAPAYALEHGIRCPNAATWTWNVLARQNAWPFPTGHTLAFDTLGRLHFIYASQYGSLSGPLHHAVRSTAGTWTTEPLDAATNADSAETSVWSMSVTADLAGGVWIGYMPRVGEFGGEKVLVHIAADGTAERRSFGTAQYSGSVVTLVDASGAVHALIDSEYKQLEYATMCPPQAPTNPQ